MKKSTLRRTRDHTFNNFSSLTVFNRGSCWARERKNMSFMPMLAEGMAGNMHVGLAALGAALGVGLIGMKASEAVGRNPGAATKILVQAILSTAFAEGIVFFAIYLAKGQ